MNEEVRNKIIILTKHYGVKQKYIANKLGVNNSTICRFIKGERELTQVNIYKLNIILKNYEGFFK